MLWPLGHIQPFLFSWARRLEEVQFEASPTCGVCFIPFLLLNLLAALAIVTLKSLRSFPMRIDVHWGWV